MYVDVKPQHLIDRNDKYLRVVIRDRIYLSSVVYYYS